MRVRCCRRVIKIVASARADVRRRARANFRARVVAADLRALRRLAAKALLRREPKALLLLRRNVDHVVQ